MNIEELFKYYKKYTIINKGEDYAIIGIPFFHFGHDEGIAIRLSDKNGQLIISDCHTTTDYLDAEGIDLNDYSDKLAVIMKKFGIFLDGNVFRMVIHDAEYIPALNRQIGYFVEAMSLIAHIDL